MKIHERIKYLRIKCGLKQDEVANLLHITQPAYQKIEKGHTKNPRKMKELAHIFNVTEEYLRFGSPSEMNEQFIPIFDWKDIPISPEDFNITKGKGTIPMFLANSKDIYAVVIKDDSMTSKGGGKTYLIGDQVIIDPHKVPEHGQSVIVKPNDFQEPILKQWLVHGNKVILVSLNDNYPKIDYDENTMKICGVVIYKVSAE